MTMNEIIFDETNGMIFDEFIQNYPDFVDVLKKYDTDTFPNLVEGVTLFQNAKNEIEESEIANRIQDELFRMEDGLNYKDIEPNEEMYMRVTNCLEWSDEMAEMFQEVFDKIELEPWNDDFEKTLITSVRENHSNVDIEEKLWLESLIVDVQKHSSLGSFYKDWFWMQGIFDHMNYYTRAGLSGHPWNYY